MNLCAHSAKNVSFLRSIAFFAALTFLFGALTFTAACGGTTPANSAGNTVQDAKANADGAVGETLGGDGGGETSLADAHDDAPPCPGTCDDVGSDDDAAGEVGDSASEIADGGGEVKTCEFVPQPEPGHPGASCKTASDCQSNLCVDGPSGKICTTACVDCCPTGFTCEQYNAGSGDQTFVCLPKIGSLCRPCDKDSECNNGTGSNSGAICVSYGDSGSFCGLPCAATPDCPGGYACSETGGSKQCVKSDGQCSCSTAAINDGAQTTCSVSNDAGTCTGVRKCTLAGLTLCPAKTPAAEVCGNKTDENCNGQTDEEGGKGCSDYFIDADSDGEGQAGSSAKCLCGPTTLYDSITSTDCADSDKAIRSGATEICNDIDDNCDGITDNGCDDDGDGWCDSKMVVVGTPNSCKSGKGDCNDGAAAISPGTQELCGNGVDDNCDGLTDSGAEVTGCVLFYTDADGDQFGTGEPVCQCGAAGLYTAITPGDCDDATTSVHPGAAEVCANGQDDNFDGQQDETGADGCLDYYADGDSDGFGAGNSSCLCAPSGDLTALKNGDCDDAAKAIHPLATEVCDGVDNNCTGGTDEQGAEGCAVYFADADTDTFGDASASACLCAASLAYGVTDSTDCNDQSAKAHPGAAEVCDGIDNDCDGATDEKDADGCQVYLADGDGDGYGVLANFACLCAPTAAYSVTLFGDCNDKDLTIHPGVTETCDGMDNNCNGDTDEAGAKGCTTLLFDGDGDGYGKDGDSACLCGKTGKYTSTVGGDCADDNADVHPKTSEICDGIDNDCDGATDPVNSGGCTSWYIDNDGDGFGTALFASKCFCGPVTGYAHQSGDCADGDLAINPDATEVCNGKDDNCDGIKDPKNTVNCTTYYADGDGDGYGVQGLSQCTCVADALFKATVGTDCNDGDAKVHPNATEICNGVDDNCDTQVDEGLMKTYYTDNDGDGWGGSASSVQCAASSQFGSTTTGDCDDVHFNVHPGATEICNMIDDNCDGQTDEGTNIATYYKDLDGDSFGAGAGQLLCSAAGQYTVTTNGDCDDAKANVYPGASEVCDGLDNDCNGGTDEGIPTATYYVDADKDNYGTGSGTVQCGPIGGNSATVGGDCDDSKVSVNPGVSEACNNVDDNCNGSTDEGFSMSTYFPDGDSDGYGTGSGVQACAKFGLNTASVGGDCNDGSSAIHPGATEVCGNNIDDNCSGSTDENCTPKCGDIQFNFESGSPGWTLGSGWNVGTWAGANGSGKGLGYGTGTAYPTSAAGSTASVQLYIPTGATTIQFDYRYSPDSNEVSTDQFFGWTGYDQIGISVGQYTNAWTRDAATGPVAWTHFTFTGIPANWGGTYQKFALTFVTVDNSDNSGFGYAIDNLSANCN